MKLLAGWGVVTHSRTYASLLHRHKSKHVKEKFPGPFVEMMNGWEKSLKKIVEAHNEKVDAAVLDGRTKALSSGIALGPLQCTSLTYKPIANRTIISLIGKHSFCTAEKFVLLPNQSCAQLDSVIKFLNRDLTTDIAAKKLIDTTFRAITPPSIHSDPTITTFQTLNPSQKRAVTAALNVKRPFVCIQGPPGTGKTKVSTEIILQCIHKNKNILVVSANHAALGEVMDRVAEFHGDDCLVYTDSFEDLTDEEQGPESEVNGVRRRRNTLAGAITDRLKSTRVVFSTASSAWVRRLSKLYRWKPDIMLVDEAGQLEEPSVWIAGSEASRIVLSGDPKQLPPFVSMIHESKELRTRSLLERLMREFANHNCNFFLNEQFRMNDDQLREIMRWSNDNFYDGRLIAHPSVAKQTIGDLSPTFKRSYPHYNGPLLFFNTDNETNMNEERMGFSWRNGGEARMIVDYVQLLLTAGISEEDIGIISPYLAQTLCLRQLLAKNDRIVVDTVDAFQGRQREIILFSTVRNNRREHVGFVSDERRLNVAVTRARRQFALFGSQRMLLCDPLLASLRKSLTDAPHPQWQEPFINLNDLKRSHSTNAVERKL